MAALMRERRAAKGAKPGQVGRPVTKVKMSPPPKRPGVKIAELKDPKKRLELLFQRHQRTLEDYDWQKSLVDHRIREAEKDGRISEAKHFMAEKSRLIKEAADYDLKMNKELALREERAAQRGSDLPITFVVNQIVPKTVPSFPIPEPAVN